MLYGDIHHKPVIVLAFIACIILFGVYTVWSFGSASAGILVMSGAVSLVLIGISRWRASSNDLSLPDVLGIETPFAATIAGLTLMQITGRLAAGASLGNQLDFGVFAIIVLLIIGISLTGRKDLVHRIPAAIEWYVATLLVSRIAGAMMAGTMPMPVLTALGRYRARVSKTDRRITQPVNWFDINNSPSNKEVVRWSSENITVCAVKNPINRLRISSVSIFLLNNTREPSPPTIISIQAASSPLRHCNNKVVIPNSTIKVRGLS